MLPRPQPALVAAGRFANSLALPGVDWAKNGKTLVLALSTQCHFCTESAPFYQRVAKAAANSAKLLAVLPQPKTEAQEYLGRMGVRVDDVRQATLGVAGTPTLFLVNSTGTVTDGWTGKLSPDKEAEVMRALGEARLPGK